MRGLARALGLARFATGHERAVMRSAVPSTTGEDARMPSAAIDSAASCRKGAPRRCALGAIVLVCCVLPASAAAAGSVYSANIIENTVSQFGVFPNGALTPLTPASVGAGVGPTGIAISPDGKSAYVSNSGESTVSQYDINPATGALSAKTPASVASGAGPRPEGIAVTPNGKSAYVTNFNDNSVSQYDIDHSTGALSAKTPASVAT